MKTLFSILFLAASLNICLSQTTPESPQPGKRLAVDPRAMQMQQAVLVFHDVQKVEELLKKGAEVNAPIGCGTYSPLDHKR